MKRGKAEKVGPMFPRLHVNDTEKGGPRAPPRNKMALYEHFTIPSRGSSNKGTGSERSYIIPGNLPSQMPTQRAESYISHQFNGASQNTSSAQLEQRNKVDEDDFMVPVYVDSRIGQYNDKRLVNFEMEKLTSMSSRNFGCSIEVQKDGGRHRKQLDSPPINIREDASSESEGLPQVSESRELHVKNISTIETIKSLARQAKVIQNQEYQDSPVEATHDAEFHDTRTGSLVQKGSSDDGDDVSKISSTENLSSLKASPDDVVGVLGQKRFWKARRKFVKTVSSLKMLYHIGGGPL